MAETRNRRTKETTNRVFKVKRAHEFPNGNVSFDFEIDGISFYRSIVVKGKEGDFVSFPSYESNGKYYHYYFIKLTDEEQNALIDAVYDSLDD